MSISDAVCCCGVVGRCAAERFGRDVLQLAAALLGAVASWLPTWYLMLLTLSRHLMALGAALLGRLWYLMSLLLRLFCGTRCNMIRGRSLMLLLCGR